MEINTGKIREHAPKAAKLLKAISNPERLMILCALIDGEKCVGDLWQSSELSQSAFSQHLAFLRRANLVKTRKDAQTVFYSLTNDHSTEIIKVLQQLFCNTK